MAIRIRNMIENMGGQSNHNLDAKYRLIIPARLRSALGTNFVLCKGMDKNIHVYPEAEWDKFSEKLNSLPISDPNARMFKSFFQSSAFECEVDGQFRVVIPQNLREWAGIDKEVVMVGFGAIAQIWNKTAWDEYNNPQNMDINAISLDVSAKYGI